MKNSRGQLALILILMFALFLQIEGVIPDIFAGSDEPIVITNEKEGLEFSAVFDSGGFKEKDELIVKATISNKSNKAIRYYAGTSSYGIRGALGVALYSLDGKSRFTDKFDIETVGTRTDASVLNGELLPGKTISCEFSMLPYFVDKGTKHNVSSGEYMLKLWYSKDTEGSIETEFPVTLTKLFGKMYLKS
ncbi:MAG: hypothetical protein WBL93_10280 [Lutisporaceae bacterium]